MSHRGITTYLVDDDAALRGDLCRLLEATGRVRVVGEAGSAEELAAALGGLRCDVILLDLSMPGRGGMSALQDLGRHPGAPPAVVLTMHDDAAHVDRALALGAAGYVLKSAPPDRIVDALEAARRGGSVLDPAVAAPLVRRHLRLSTREPSRSSALAPRQRDVLRGIAFGLANKEIAGRLGLSEETVKGYVRDLYDRIGVRSRSAAVAWAARNGLID